MTDPLARIRDRISAYTPRDMRVSLGDLTPAGVLVPLFVEDGQVSVLLTKRASGLKKHRGEISFPGGKCDEEDASLLACALRETHEEIGLPPERVEPLGRLDETPVITQYRMTPYVGIIPFPFDFALNRQEIESLVLAPLATFMEPSRHRMTISEWGGYRIPIHFYELPGQVVWGATGRVLTQLLKVCFDYIPPVYAAYLETERDPLLLS